MQIIRKYLLGRKRASISRELDHVYADMRAATEKAQMVKRLAEQEEAQLLRELAQRERALIAKAKQIDAHLTLGAMPVRRARSW